MDAPHPTEIAPPTPEQLLKLLDLQLQQERAKRAPRGRKRAGVLAAGLVVIIVTIGLAMLVAQQMVAEARQHARPAPAAAEE